MKSTSLLLFVTAVLVFHSSARAGPYSLEIIAQAGDVIDGRTIIGFSGEQLSVKINNSGEVAFFADFSSGFFVDLGLLTQGRFIAGAGKVIDGRVLGFGSEPNLDMNNHGDVVYQADWDGGSGIFVNETLLVEADVTVIDGHTVRQLSRSPTINDAGTVLFSADTLEFNGLFTQSELLLRGGQSFEGLTISNAGGIHNNAGKVVFFTSFREDENTLLLLTFDDGILVKEGDVIDGLTVRKLRWPGLTDAGEVYMKVDGLDAGGEQIHFIATLDRILFRSDDIVDGIQVPILANSVTPMNNNGQLAFLGAADAPGFMDGQFDDMRITLFAAGEAIISEGDLLDGKIIKRLGRFDINDHGDVAFEVVFEDYSKAVVVATPTIPEPSSAALAATGALLLLTARRKRKGRR